jgi:hypothetical protein
MPAVTEGQCLFGILPNTSYNVYQTFLAVYSVKLCQADSKTYVGGKYKRREFALFCTAKFSTDGVEQLRLAGTAIGTKSYTV